MGERLEKVAEGEIPLVAAKGEEIPRYKQLDSTNRLLILKALCELRAHQDDTVSYINDALKEGNQISSFHKDKIGGDGNGTSYWYDGNKTIGYRLYRELNIYPSKRNSKGKGCLTPPAISSQWETLATNLDEFRKVVDELSGSKVVAEVDVSKTIETDAIPVLEKLQKNKDRALKQKQRQEMLLNYFTKPLAAGITRSCRTRRPVSYTFENWAPHSWKSKKALQLPEYPDPDELGSVLNTLEAFPPIVFASEARKLEERLAQATFGEAFLLQGGDCAESFKEFNANNIRDSFRVLLQMGIVLTYGAQIPIIKVLSLGFCF
uniref:Phospho-2-dehydro-3-deoxyheptonate aldolase n=1 Tax=Fagus sylvatica TaxID=28930 RepID=A0A2N9F0Y1_FAGSY